MERISELEEKNIAIVGMGKSWFDYNMAKSHGAEFDEVWAINAVADVIFHDRVFMMDPASRFLDSDDAGGQTNSMSKLLTEHEGPVYTCELDDRCPGLVEYPIDEILGACGCHYLNNTVAYAIAFALYNKVKHIQLFGVDFGYKNNLYFAEAGRGCVEFWLSKCMSEGIKVEVAQSSYLLDAAVPAEEKLYGYHRLDDPMLVMSDSDGNLKSMKRSQGIKYQEPDDRRFLPDVNKSWIHLRRELEGEGKKLSQVIRDYIDNMEWIMKKYSKKLAPLFTNYLKKRTLKVDPDSGDTPDWDELVVNNFTIKKVHVSEIYAEDFEGDDDMAVWYRENLQGLPYQIWDEDSKLSKYIAKIVKKGK